MTRQEKIDELIAEVTARISAEEAHAKQFTFTKFNHVEHVSCGDSFNREGVETKVDGNFNGVAFEAVRFTKSSNGWRVSLLPKGEYYYEKGHGCFSTLKEAKRHALQYSGAA